MRLRFFTLMFLCLSMQWATAQTVDYNQVITPDSVVPASFQERLIRLAWRNYPLNRTFDAQIDKAAARVKEEQLGILDPISVQLNYGEPHINPNFEAAFFPRYLVGVNLNVGQIMSNPQRVKQARADQEIATHQLDAQKLAIRYEVIRRYQDYLMKLELLKLHIKTQEDNYTTYLDLTQKFQEGSVGLDAYTQTAVAYNRATEDKIKAEADVAIAKAHLEELLGVPLEQVR